MAIERTYFDWKRFCDMHRIRYVTHGPNTAKNHISIRCPFCGSTDPSEHMGLHLDPHHPAWGCLRNTEHRGRDPTRLISTLLGCSQERARGLVQMLAPEFDVFEETAAQLLHRNAVIQDARTPAPKSLTWPPNMHPVTEHGYGPKFLDYLSGRGMEPADEVAQYYNLRYCLVGRFKWRLVIPFRLEGKLVGWTGRTITNDPLRYLTLPVDREVAKRWGLPTACYDPDQYVWDQTAVIHGNRVLVVCEGPLDVLKLDWYKPSTDYTVTCTFGMPKTGQVEFLGNAARHYQLVAVILDRAAFSNAMILAQQIEELSGVRTVVQQPEAKDPGALSCSAVTHLLSSLS